MFPDTEFVFDLELPVEFIPSNADGEVQKFELVPANECYERLFSSDFKTTSIPVVLDFMIRHGLVNPENGKTYFLKLFLTLITLLIRMFRSLRCCPITINIFDCNVLIDL